MPRKALFYCLKVWLTGVVIGPLFYYLMDRGPVDSLLSFPEFIFICEIGGLLLSIPSFLVLWAITVYLCKRPGDPLLQRLKLAGWALLFTILPMVVVLVWQNIGLSGSDLSRLIRFLASYYTPILAAIFFYRLPAYQPAADRATTPSLNSSPGSPARSGSIDSSRS